MEMKPYPGYECFFADLETVVLDVSGRRPPEEMEEIRDRYIPGPEGAPEVKIRVYRRRGLENVPVVIDLHPGGFTMGGLPMCNERCIGFAMNVPCVAIGVDYRLAPKHQYPAQLEDCRAVLEYVVAHPEEFGADPSRVALVGTSAGGNLAAGLCLWLRDHGGPKIALQILNYPAVVGSATTHSALMLGDSAPLVQASGLRKLMDVYTGCPDGCPVPYYAKPGLAPDLSGLPPAMVVTCEYDPLRDEGIDYARRLMAHGVQTEIHSMPRVCHAYDEMDTPLRGWIRQGMHMALQREFGML